MKDAMLPALIAAGVVTGASDAKWKGLSVLEAAKKVGAQAVLAARQCW